MSYNAQRARKVVHRQIKALGGRRGAIVRDGTPTEIFLRVLDQTSKSGRGDFNDTNNRHVIISTFTKAGKDMVLRPDKDSDTIILYTPDASADSTDVEQTLRLISRPTFIEVQGIVCLWDIQVAE